MENAQTDVADTGVGKVVAAATPGDFPFVLDQWYVACCLSEVPKTGETDVTVCARTVSLRRDGDSVQATCRDTGALRHCQVSEDLVWLYVGRNDGISEPKLPVPEFGGPGGKVRFFAPVTMPVNLDDAAYGLLDPAHTPFVHRSPIWRGNGKLKNKQKTFEPSELGFTMVPHAPVNSDIYKLIGGSISVRIHFRLPGLRAEYIQNAKHTVLGLTALTPIDEGNTALRQIFFWNSPILAAIRPLVGPFARGFLQQDVDIMTHRNENLRFGGRGMLLGDSDKQFMWFVQLKKAWRTACETGAPFVNPLEPATLRWKT